MIKIISPCRSEEEAEKITEHVKSVMNDVIINYKHICNIGPLIFRNRNRGMDSNNFYDYLQWDSDIRATPDDVRKIINNTDITGGAYKHRNFNRICASVTTTEPLEEKDMLLSIDSKGIIQTPWVGAGFLYIPNNCLRKLTKPYFRHIDIPDDQTGEDVGFCLNAYNSGLKVYVDCNVFLRHLV